MNKIEIIEGNLKHNYRFLSSLNPRIKIAPVLKSNAYGHGIVEVAEILSAFSPPFFCVDGLHEAFTLMKAKIKIPILIMGFTNPDNLAIKKLPFSFAVYSLEHLLGIIKNQPQAGIHLFIDTGMHREGIRMDELSDFVRKIKEIGNIKIEGLMSHLAMADKASNALTKLQVKNFDKARKALISFGIKPKWFHLGASAGLLNRKDLGEKYIGNLARVGIALYQGTLRLKSTLVQIKSLKNGESIGYDFTFKAKRNMTMGILPIGYNDGIDRGLSNKGLVKIGHVFCPIIGRVSMNITTIDLSKVTHPYVGQEVTVISENKEDPNSVEKIARTTAKIPYEVLVGLKPEINREIKED